MSLGINTTTPEGMVMAADSRQSYRNRKGMARIGSDNASKLFQLNERMGVLVTGLAFLPEDGVMKNVTKFIEQYKREADLAGMSVHDMAEGLYDLFDVKYDWQKRLDDSVEKINSDLRRQGFEVVEIKQEKNLVKFQYKDKNKTLRNGVVGIEIISLMVAGFNRDGSHEVYVCRIPGEIQKKRDSKEKGKEYGASWIGQTDVISRIILGFDWRINNFKFMQEANKEYGAEEIRKQLSGLQYAIQWGIMTLQDAIDFCTLMIRTTSAMQRFSDGIMANPGDMPGVGGPVDVAIITADGGFKWIHKKQLKIEEE